MKNKSNKKTLVMASGIIILSLLLLIGGIILIPKLTEGANTYDPDNMNGKITPEQSITTPGTTEVTNALEEKIDVKYTKADLEYRDGYQTTLWDIYRLTYDSVYVHSANLYVDLPNSILLANGQAKQPGYLPEGYTVLQKDIVRDENIMRSTYTSDNKNSFDITIDQSKVPVYAEIIFTNEEKVYFVECEGFFGLLTEYKGKIDFYGNEGIFRNLYIHDGGRYYRIGGIGIEREELVKIALSLNTEKIPTPVIRVEKKDEGLSGDFINLPVGYYYGFVDTVGKYNLVFDNKDTKEEATAFSHSTYGNTVKEVENYPNGEGYEGYELVDGVYIYRKNGKDMFKYSVYNTTYGHTIRYSGENCSFYRVKVGEHEGLLTLNLKKDPVLYWNDGECSYSLSSFDESMDAEKLLELAKSVGKGNKITKGAEAAFKESYKGEYKQGEIWVELALVERESDFFVTVKSYTKVMLYHDIIIQLYDNGAAGRKLSINEGCFFSSVDGGNIYEIVISKEAFESFDELLINFNGGFDSSVYSAWNLSYDGEKISCTRRQQSDFFKAE